MAIIGAGFLLQRVRAGTARMARWRRGCADGAHGMMLAAPDALRKQSVFELSATMVLVFSHGSGFFWQAPGTLIRAQGSRTRCSAVQ
ncbi:hypothetical protein [Devosia enhydra]|uniref:hypothetical protein n=1 Tax=Devosia enhydra TaxID=665118 RepID=UPI0011604D08|nr:hypothetical protein [Devosia enhydra]